MVRPHPVDRVNDAAEDVVAAPEDARALDGLDVLGFLDNTDHAGITPRITTDRAFIVFGEVPANNTVLDLMTDRIDRSGQAFDILGLGLEKVQCHTLRALWPDSGKLSQFIDEVLKSSFVHASPPTLVVSLLFDDGSAQNIQNCWDSKEIRFGHVLIIDAGAVVLCRRNAGGCGNFLRVFL